MTKIKVYVHNQSDKIINFHYLSSQGVLSPNAVKEISISIGDTLYFDNESDTRYLITGNMEGTTIFYNK